MKFRHLILDTHAHTHTLAGIAKNPFAYFGSADRQVIIPIMGTVATAKKFRVELVNPFSREGSKLLYEGTDIHKAADAVGKQTAEEMIKQFSEQDKPKGKRGPRTLMELADSFFDTLGENAPLALAVSTSEDPLPDGSFGLDLSDPKSPKIVANNDASDDAFLVVSLSEPRSIKLISSADKFPQPFVNLESVQASCGFHEGHLMLFHLKKGQEIWLMDESNGNRVGQHAWDGDEIKTTWYSEQEFMVYASTAGLGLNLVPQLTEAAADPEA